MDTITTACHCPSSAWRKINSLFGHLKPNRAWQRGSSAPNQTKYAVLKRGRALLPIGGRGGGGDYCVTQPPLSAGVCCVQMSASPARSSYISPPIVRREITNRYSCNHMEGTLLRSTSTGNGNGENFNLRTKEAAYFFPPLRCGRLGLAPAAPLPLAPSTSIGSAFFFPTSSDSSTLPAPWLPLTGPSVRSRRRFCFFL